MSPKPSDEASDAARFEAMLREVLTTDEEAREHRSAKDLRTVARQRAVGAKAQFANSRERGPKSRGRGPVQKD
ncbi:MAG TPA: hypothetical protein VEZ16_17720 [Microvirga sp.]|nr:hypothetical protein [Microvirga sp.]